MRAAAYSYSEDTERENVGAAIHRTALQLLRRHVGWRPDSIPGTRGGGGTPTRMTHRFAREAEIENLQPPVASSA